MADAEFLRSTPVLQGLDEDEFEQIAAIAQTREFRRGQRVFEREAEADAFYIIRRGHFALTLMLRALDQDVDLAIQELGVRDAFGWSALLRPHEWIYSVYCTDDGETICFPAEELRGLLVGHGGVGLTFASNVGELVSSRLRILQGLWIEEVQRSIERVSHWLNTDPSVHLRTALESAHAGEKQHRGIFRRM